MKTQAEITPLKAPQENYPFLFALPMQLVFTGSVMLADLTLTGSIGPIWPALALFAGGYFGFRRLDKTHSMVLDHALIRRASVVSAVGLWAVSIALYSYVVINNPSDVGFSLGYLWFFAPVVSLAPAIGALVMTLCSGELAAMLCDNSPIAHMVTRGDPFVREDEACSPCCPTD